MAKIRQIKIIGGDKMTKLEMLEQQHTEQRKLYEVKNKKYNDSFSSTFKEYGNQVLCIRIEDKIARLKNLLLRNENDTDDESVYDTLTDLANYANMAMIELKMKEQTQVNVKKKIPTITHGEKGVKIHDCTKCLHDETCKFSEKKSLLSCDLYEAKI